MKSSKHITGFLAVAWIILGQFAIAEELTNVISQKPFPVFWGKETNGIKAGLYIGQMPVKLSTWFEPILMYNDQTNARVSIPLYLPPLKNRYRAELTDDSGNGIDKTAKGKAIGLSFPPLRVAKDGATFGINRRAGYMYYALVNKIADEQQSGMFTLQDYFDVKKSGKYHLRFETCVTIPQARSDDLVWLPPVAVDVEVQLDQ